MKKKKRDLNRTVTRKTSELQGTSWKEDRGLRLHGVSNLLRSESWGRAGGWGGTPFNGLQGEASPKMGTFLRLRVYEKVGIL